MEKEKFDPSDPKYKKVEDLPTEVRYRFVQHGEGFTRKLVDDYRDERDNRNYRESPALTMAEAEITNPEVVRKVNELLEQNDQRIFAAHEKMENLKGERNLLQKEIEKICASIEEPLREWSNQQLNLMGHEGYLFLGDNNNRMSGEIDGKNIRVIRKDTYFDGQVDHRELSSVRLAEKLYNKYKHCAFDMTQVWSAQKAASTEQLKKRDELQRMFDEAYLFLRNERDDIKAREKSQIDEMSPDPKDIEVHNIVGNLLD